MATSAEAPPRNRLRGRVGGRTQPGVWADPTDERFTTAANGVTAVRTVAAVILAGVAAHEDSLRWLVAALVVYWLGDMLDGFVARQLGCETRTGAVLDILCDRLCAAAFYIGVMWLEPSYAPAVLVYLTQFIVLDCFLSLAFLAWPLRSPNYFYVVDRPLWLWNWSKPGKTANSSLFAVLLLATGWVWLGVAIALALTALKVASLIYLGRLGLPVPPVPVDSLEPAVESAFEPGGERAGEAIG